MPQPIDFQTEAARLIKVERIQQVVDRASLVAQQRLSVEADEVRLQAEEDVNETRETGQEPLDEDGRRRTPFVGRRRSRHKNQTEQEPRLKRPDEGRHLDISV